MRQVLVVGAGPCGLAAACALRRHGVSVRVVESALEPRKGSRAVQLWPPALEVLDDLGVLDEALAAGQRVHAMSYHLAGGPTLRVAVGAENEPLLLPQETTDGLLEGALAELGVRVERGTAVTDVVAGDGFVKVEVTGPDGPEVIEADWLLGADGVHSTVRERLGVEFPGAQVPMPFLIAEGEVDGEYEQGAVHYFLGRTGSLVFAPMRHDVVRIGAIVAAATPETPEGVQALLDERGPGGLRLTGVDRIAKFTSHERIATAFQGKRWFLLGDAAHTHSAVGGQGLNLGLQDVRNLVWRLAGVIHGRFDPAVLDSYDAERRTAAEQVVGITRRFVRMFTLGPFGAKVRNASWSALESSGLLRRWFAPLVAGRRVHYPDVLLGTGRRRSTRAPARVVAAAGRDPARLRLVTTGPAAGAVARLAAAIADRAPDRVAHHHLARGRAGFLVLRPDDYVAARGTRPAELADVEESLNALAAR
ncbi:FAD-dependent monooxygenase [Saccharothrix obliqua]|uniref:FAD-dependent monooxygenase n=1 Tax=Saccharothrix obliqua TaxID=2861747 RepID=UPI001C5FE8A9|nr:FAD-dependent monooxygenase [Saccharothrix obliqua]MBW4721552.1 FAD-dependent monooxygenase [Saccharothrix obliqua]